jgi:hypothetical protein
MVKICNKDENHDNTVMNIDKASFWEECLLDAM